MADDPPYPSDASWPHGLEGFLVAEPMPKDCTNLVLPLSHPEHGRWWLKVFTDCVHPRLQIYDAADRELLAHRLGALLGGLVPACYRIPDRRFTLLTRHAGSPLTMPRLDAMSVEDRRAVLAQLAKLIVFSHWIGDAERAEAHVMFDDAGRLTGIDYQCAGPGAREDPRYLVWPWTMDYTGKPDITVDDVEFMVHFGSYPPRRPEKPGVQRLIVEYLPELREAATYEPAIVEIQSLPPASIEQAFTGLSFYQRGSWEGHDLNQLYISFLLDRRPKLHHAFTKWCEWLQDRATSGETLDGRTEPHA